jgi:hypothetical protein
MRLGDDAALREYAAITRNPNVRTGLLHAMNPSRVDLQDVLPLIYRSGHDEADALRNVGLGAVWRHAIESPVRDSVAELRPHLLSLYRQAPDAECHAITRLLLRKVMDKEDLQVVDRELAKLGRVGSRRWYIDRSGLTMAVIDPQDGQFGKSENLKHTFGISTTEITFGLFERREPGHTQSFAHPDAGKDAPVHGLYTVQAARFCNWLSAQEKIPRDQWCYPDDEKLLTMRECHPVDGFLDKEGYRLPTREEWIYACRAGSETSRFFGDNPALMQFYAWDRFLSQGSLRAVATLLPNALGLSDTYGNVSEMCIVHSGKPAEISYVSCGGRISMAASVIGSDTVSPHVPNALRSSVGFRVVRTLK